MLIKLTSPSTAPLQSLNFNPALPADGDSVVVVGFGDTDSGPDSVSSTTVLQKATVEATDMDNCINIFGLTNLDKKNIV